MTTTYPKQDKPLSGVRVIELSHMVMGPTAGVILADMGAEVIKVEPLEGDKTRQLKGSGAGFFPMYNRNKKSLCLDIKQPAGFEVLMRILAGSDVLLENFRSGALDQIGLGYEALSCKFEGLIYCSLKGFLPGPYAHRTALDEVTQMMGGLAYMTGPSGRPLRAGASVIDVMGGTFGALGVLAALHERKRTGRGQHINSALFETTAFLVGQHMAQEAVLGVPVAPMPERVSAWAIYDVFTTKDDLPLFVGVVSDGQWQTFCQAFGLAQLAVDESLKTNNQRIEQRPMLLEQIGALFATFSRDELGAKLEEIGMPFAPIAKPGDLFDDPHLNASQGLLDVHTPDGKSARLPALPLQMNQQRFGLYQDLPKAGEHSRAVLKQYGYSEDEIQAFLTDRLIADASDRPVANAD